MCVIDIKPRQKGDSPAGSAPGPWRWWPCQGTGCRWTPAWSESPGSSCTFSHSPESPVKDREISVISILVHEWVFHIFFHDRFLMFSFLTYCGAFATHSFKNKYIFHVINIWQRNIYALVTAQSAVAWSQQGGRVPPVWWWPRAGWCWWPAWPRAGCGAGHPDPPPCWGSGLPPVWELPCSARHKEIQIQASVISNRF